MSSALDDDFRDFVVASTPALFRTAFMLTGDRGHAQDLVQTALMKVSRRWSEIDVPQARYAYVRRAMVNTQTSWLRRRRVTEHIVDVVPEPDPQLDDWEVREGRTLPALAQLPARMRAVLVLRFYEDLSEAETARLLGCSVGTVKSQTSRGLDRLRTHFTGERRNASVVREELA